MATTERPVAFAGTDEFTTSTRKQRRVERKLSFHDVRDRLLDEGRRAKDLLVPYKDLRAGVRQVAENQFVLTLNIKGHGAYRVYEPVLDQISHHCSMDDARTLPTSYLRTMLSYGDSEPTVLLAAENINRWLTARSGEHHKNRKGQPIRDGEKRVRVRLLMSINGPDKGEYVCRALLSDRYLVIPNAQLILTAFNVVTGNDGKAGSLVEAASAARGAVMFDWAHTPFELNMGFVNPMFAMDLRHPEKGVVTAQTSEMEGGGHAFLYPGASKAYRPGYPQRDPDHHWVMPAAFISNSETGGGSASVETSLLEAVCENTAKLVAYSRRHTGARQVSLEDYESESTQRKYIELIGSQFADSLRQVFDVKKFEENCRRFLGLFDLGVTNVEETTKWMLQQAQALDLLGDALKAYEQFNPGRNSVGDVQRVLTNIAQEQPAAKADRLNALAGDLLSGEIKVKKDLLVTA